MFCDSGNANKMAWVSVGFFGTNSSKIRLVLVVFGELIHSIHIRNWYNLFL